MTFALDFGTRLAAQPLLLPALLSVLVSGVLRGFTGFGSALFSVPVLSMMFAPAQAAPVVMGLQILSGFQTLRGDWTDIDAKSAAPLCLAGSLFSAVGAGLLVNLSPGVVKLVMGVIVLCAVVFLLFGWRFSRRPGFIATSAVGAASGVLNGFSAMGGPPLIVYFLGGPFSARAARATMTFVFMVQGAVSLATVAWLGGVTAATIACTVALFPVLAIGTWLGVHAFKRASPPVYRGVAIITLTILALFLIANTFIGR